MPKKEEKPPLLFQDRVLLQRGEKLKKARLNCCVTESGAPCKRAGAIGTVGGEPTIECPIFTRPVPARIAANCGKKEGPKPSLAKAPRAKK